MKETAISFTKLFIKTLCIIALSLSFVSVVPVDAKQVIQTGGHWTIDTVQTVSEIQPYNSAIQTNYHANFYIDITINFDAYYSGSFTFENKHIGSQNWFPNFIVIGAKCNSQSFHSYSDGLYETYNLTFTNTNCIIIRIVHSWTSISFSLDPSTFLTKDWIDGDYVNVKYVNSSLNNVVDDVDLYDKLVDIDTNITGLKNQLLNSITTTNTQLATLHDDMINLLNAINNINLDVNVTLDEKSLSDYSTSNFVSSVEFLPYRSSSFVPLSDVGTSRLSSIRYSLISYRLSGDSYYIFSPDFSYSPNTGTSEVESFTFSTGPFDSSSVLYFNSSTVTKDFYILNPLYYWGNQSTITINFLNTVRLSFVNNNVSFTCYKVPKLSSLGSYITSLFSLNNSNLINLKLDTITDLINELLKSTDTGATDPTVPDIQMPDNFLDLSNKLNSQDEIENNYFDSLGNNFNDFVLPEFNSEHSVFSPLIAISSGFSTVLDIFFDTKLSIVIYVALALIILRVILC